MRLPSGRGGLSGKTVCLNKSLYGLKQASRTWNDLLVSRLLALGFEQCFVDPCIFRLKNKSSGRVSMMLGAHVDDMIAAGYKDDCDRLCLHLRESFSTNILGDLRYYTGCSFTRQKGKITISQHACIAKLTEKLGMYLTSDTPACTRVDLSPRSENGEESEGPYREVVGSLLWVANTTRSDISNAVRDVARHAHSPSKTHWATVVKIVKCLRLTPS